MCLIKYMRNFVKNSAAIPVFFSSLFHGGAVVGKMSGVPIYVHVKATESGAGF